MDHTFTHTSTDPETRCGQCGSSRLSTTLQKDVFAYGSGARSVELSATVPVFKCADCGFEFTNHLAESRRHDAVCAHLDVLTPAQVREIRAQTGLSRDRFAELTGLGAASLARWETGELIQSTSHDKFLRLLSYPDNLERLSSGREEPRAPRVDAIGVSRAKRAFRTLEASHRLEERTHASMTFTLRATSRRVSVN